MKSLATYKNDICLVAGSGDFVYEAAIYLNQNKRLSKIILISQNYKLKKKFKSIIFEKDIRNLELIIKHIKKESLINVLILGYVKLPPINKIKLSLKSKLQLSKNFFLNNINDQSLILKKFLKSKNINLLSQKKTFKDLLISKIDNTVKNKHIKIQKNINSDINYIKRIFSLNLSQSLIMNGNRIIALEDINGTDDLIKRIGNTKIEFNNLIFIKGKKSKQIDEIDFPVIGEETLNLLIKYNFKAICLFNNQVIASNKNIFIDKIKKSNLSLIVL